MCLDSDNVVGSFARYRLGISWPAQWLTRRLVKFTHRHPHTSRHPVVSGWHIHPFSGKISLILVFMKQFVYTFHSIISGFLSLAPHTALSISPIKLLLLPPKSPFPARLDSIVLGLIFAMRIVESSNLKLTETIVLIKFRDFHISVGMWNERRRETRAVDLFCFVLARQCLHNIYNLRVNLIHTLDRRDEDELRTCSKKNTHKKSQWNITKSLSWGIFQLLLASSL